MLNINQCDSNFNKIPAPIVIKQSHETETPQSMIIKKKKKSLHLIKLGSVSVQRNSRAQAHRIVKALYVNDKQSSAVVL